MSKESKKPYLGKAQSYKITESDKLIARTKINLAFEITGLVKEGRKVCPSCGCSDPKKVKTKTSAENKNIYWQCHKCSAFGDAIDLLVKYHKMKFNEAVSLLLGRGNFDLASIAEVVTDSTIEESFKAKVDKEVYNYLHTLGNQELAIEYYGKWHISPSAVKESGSVVFENTRKIHQNLLSKFTRDRLIDAGLITIDKQGRDFFLFNDDYNVLEPHIDTNGDLVGMQFRPSKRQMKKVQAHKDWKKKWSNHFSLTGEKLDPSDAWDLAYKQNPEETGEKFPYVTPFLSLKGASDQSLIGCGIWRINKLKSRSNIYIVEGFKDLLAARTMGVEAYAIPGVGVMPPKILLDTLKEHHMILMLDGDDAGEMGRNNLLNYFKEQKISASLYPNIRKNMDVTDLLVERFAHKNCTCLTCSKFVKEHPYNKDECPCKSCKK